MSTFVLVHGAWHGAWCWFKVAPLLRAQGHRVLAFDLPAHGIDRRPTAEGTLENYAARVCEVLDRSLEPVVLVGHSMGGAVISQASELRPKKIERLIYVTAFLIPAGVTFGEVAQRDTASIATPHIRFSADQSTAMLDPGKAREVFYADCSEADVELALALLVPISATIFAAQVHTTAANFGGIPRDYIECTEDRAITIGAQRAMHRALPCERVVTLQSSHSPFFSMADRLAAELVSFGDR